MHSWDSCNCCSDRLCQPCLKQQERNKPEKLLCEYTYVQLRRDCINSEELQIDCAKQNIRSSVSPSWANAVWDMLLKYFFNSMRKECQINLTLTQMTQCVARPLCDSWASCQYSLSLITTSPVKTDHSNIFTEHKTTPHRKVSVGS